MNECNFKAKLLNDDYWCNLARQPCFGEKKCIFFNIEVKNEL